MKIFSLFACALIAFAAGAQAQAPSQVVPGAIKITKILPAIVKTPDYQLSTGPKKTSKIGDWLEIEVEFDSLVDEVDEIQFNYTIAIEGRLLEGTVTHVNIPKGREHYSVMYVSPRALEKLTQGKAFNIGGVKNVWVIATKSGQMIGQSAMRNEAIPNAQKMTGAVLNKMETPFAPLFFDRYEAIKAK